jgi:acetyl esterase/lipase
VGQKGGGFPGTLEDVGRAADFLPDLKKKHPVDITRVVALGHSAGGQLALWLGGRQHIDAASKLHRAAPFRLHGIVGLAAISDLVKASALHLGDGIVDQFMGGAPETIPERYAAASPLALLPLGIPQRIIHGSNDQVVPISLSEIYSHSARARGDDAILEALPGVGHYELIDPTSSAWSTVHEAVRALFQNP